MMSCRTSERWTLSAALLLLVSHILLPGGPARAAVGPEVVLQPTPLVLKDGRIANVSIHVLPFGSGDRQLPQDVAARLAELSAAAATDCFLTAQVIGHVSSREVAENETLAAHRLARARADAVQAALIGSGLPAKAIASVWDWQFLVREPRATLWMFRLVEGEDCEGLPLDGGDALVADAEAPAQAASGRMTAAAPPQPEPEVAQAPQAAEPPLPASSAPRAEANSPADLAGMVGSAVAAEPPPEAETAPVVAAARPARERTAGASDERAVRQAAAPQPAAQAAKPTDSGAVAAGPAGDAVPTLTRPLPALSPAPADPEPAQTAVAALEPRSETAAATAPRSTAATPQARTAAVAPQHPERQGKVEWGQDNVVITFATNSSYFPPGTTRRLRTLLGNLPEDGRYRVQLEVGVSGSDTVVGAKSPEEARRYNRWLAERRLDRVREWLDENAAGRRIEIEPAFQPDDNSRRVVVRVAPVG